MLLVPILLTWVLMGTVTTVQCTGLECRPVRPSRGIAPTHRMAVYSSSTTCETARRHLQELSHAPVPSQGNPRVTVRRIYTYTCQAREDPL